MVATEANTSDRKLIKLESEISDAFSALSFSREMSADEDLLRLRYNRIYLITEGTGSIKIDGFNYHLSNSGLLLAGKGQILSFEKCEGLKGFEIMFGDCFWKRAPSSATNCKAVLFNDVSANQQLTIDQSDTLQLRLLFKTISAEFLNDNYSNKLDVLAAYLKIIMIKIGNINAGLIGAVDDFEKKIYRRFLELVSDQYKTCHDVSQFASQLFVTPRKLTEICRHSAGKGAKEVINGQLISEAKRSLLFSPTTIKEISYSLSFATPEQFCHFFKKNTGTSPNSYRNTYVSFDS